MNTVPPIRPSDLSIVSFMIIFQIFIIQSFPSSHSIKAGTDSNESVLLAQSLGLMTALSRSTGPGACAAATAGKIVSAHCLGESGCFVGAVYV
jgi:zona occludens toxin (predicted ATPase)